MTGEHLSNSQMLSESGRDHRPAAKAAAKPLVTDRPQPTPVEQTPSSEDCIDVNRHTKSAYGSEGWGFESLRARQEVFTFQLPPYSHLPVTPGMVG